MQLERLMYVIKNCVKKKGKKKKKEKKIGENIFYF